MKSETSLLSETGEAVALKSVHLTGRLEGLMLNMKVQQRYRNDTGKNLETVYTFPMAWGATLLGLNVEIAGKRLNASVIEKKAATVKYEKAIEDGDTPVMVELTALGLYTANLGNLKDKEEVTIEIEYGQLLRFEQGQLRVCIPTVIAPRFGDAHKTGGLALHETTSADPMAEYPLTLKLEILGPMAKAKFSCPSHQISTTAIEDGLAVLLKSGGLLDRDFILSLDGLAGQSFAVTAPDGDQKIMLASFCPEMPIRESEPLLMKILVDCSGSMVGNSMESAKAAIHGILEELNSNDLISYSRFGSEVHHDLNILSTCTPSTIQHVAAAISQTKADLGGTELNAALISTFKDIKAPAIGKLQPSVLLITDGDVWEVDSVIQASVKSGQRIFAIGVGSSPAESLLRELAAQSGGACELVSPNENIAAAIVRMFRRMRTVQGAKLKVEWDCAPLWQSPLPVQIYEGETVHIFARFNETPSRSPQLIWEIDDQTCRSVPETLSESQSPALARLAADKQMAAVSTAEESLALSLKYQLVSKQSNLFLVHVREGEDKAVGLPSLQQIQQMQAAGHSGFGNVQQPRALMGNFFRSRSKTVHQASVDYNSIDVPSVYRTSRTQAAGKVNALGAGGMDDFEIPAFLRKAPDGVKKMPAPSSLLNAFNGSAVTSIDFSRALSSVSFMALNTEIEKMIAALLADSLTTEQAWAVFLDWLAIQLAKEFTLERHAQRMLKAELAVIEKGVRDIAHKKLAVLLPSLGLNDWGKINGWSPQTKWNF